MSFIKIFVNQENKQLAKKSERYGVNIGNTGIEFINIKDREKFLVLLAYASSVEINDCSGIQYKEGKIKFGVYQRDSERIGVRCVDCETLYFNGKCVKRHYEYKSSYGTNGLSDTTNFICDACFDRHKKEVAEIKIENLKEKEKLGVE